MVLLLGSVVNRLRLAERSCCNKRQAFDDRDRMNGFEEGANQARLFFDKENRKVGPRMKECKERDRNEGTSTNRRNQEKRECDEGKGHEKKRGRRRSKKQNKIITEEVRCVLIYL
jgi:hypothetical protein